MHPISLLSKRKLVFEDDPRHLDQPKDQNPWNFHNRRTVLITNSLLTLHMAWAIYPRSLHFGDRAMAEWDCVTMIERGREVSWGYPPRLSASLGVPLARQSTGFRNDAAVAAFMFCFFFRRSATLGHWDNTFHLRA